MNKSALSAASLLQCLTPNDARKAFRFKATGINVYSFEEALYHFYHYWRQSADDCVSEEFIDWTHGVLGLPHIASRLREISAVENFTERFCAFLATASYFSDKKINALKKELGEWENRLEWEKLKERGDYLMNTGNYRAAFTFYKRALTGLENAAVLNNAAVALMKQARYIDAAEYFERAMDAAPDNVRFALNYIEALIFGGHYDKAWLAAGRVEVSNRKEISEIAYFRGEINFRFKRYYPSVPYYERAISVAEQNGEDTLPQYIFRLCDVYIKLRQNDKALETVNRCKVQDSGFLRKQAEVHTAQGNLPAAIRCIEAALRTTNGNAEAELRTRLASYHRMYYDLAKAEDAIAAAVRILPNDPHVKLECAKLRKAQGRMKEYQDILSEVLGGFKAGYRSSR